MRTVIALTLSVLLAGSVLLLVLLPKDYMDVIAANWDLELPESDRCLYETDSGPSPHGDGERYHVFRYTVSGSQGIHVAWQSTPSQEVQGQVTDILDGLSVPREWRPDLTECRCFTMTACDSSELYLLLNSAGTRLYVVEFFL